jgi:hypothetical protein
MESAMYEMMLQRLEVPRSPFLSELHARHLTAGILIPP